MIYICFVAQVFCLLTFFLLFIIVENLLIVDVMLVNLIEIIFKY